jgi:hypothetical protein
MSMLLTQALRIQAQLRNLPVTKAFHSFGSMMVFHFGELQDYSDGRHTYQRGEFTLIVEIARWQINRRRRTLATNDSDKIEIKKVVPQFLGARVKSARLACPASRLSFTGGLRLSLQPDDRLFGDKGDLCNWVLYRTGVVAIRYDYRALKLSSRPDYAMPPPLT